MYLYGVESFNGVIKVKVKNMLDDLLVCVCVYVCSYEIRFRNGIDSR